MTTEDHPPSGHAALTDTRLDRLVFFSDAVFAIAITLLIIDVHPPAGMRGQGDAAWLAALAGILPSLGSFMLSFLVVGAIWSSHHTALSMLVRFHPRLVWPNLLMLMAVAVLPFPTALLSTGSVAHVPFIVYGGTLLAVGLLKAWLFSTALRPDLTDPAIPPARIALERRRMWLLPGAALVTMVLAGFFPGWCNLALLLLLVGRRLRPFREAKGAD
jgi:uncharacterized membrane protein